MKNNEKMTRWTASLYRKIQIRENPYPGKFYLVRILVLNC